MKIFACVLAPVILALAAGGAGAAPPAAPPISWITWTTVVNNGDFMPTEICDPADPVNCRTFNSYNQPSVNTGRLVVFRARSKGGGALGEPVHGIYTRDMSSGAAIVRIFDRDTQVPGPNNRNTTFTEPPSFPRIDMNADTVVTRGNHQPVWQVTNDAGEVAEQVGTSGIYANPYGSLLTAASRLGSGAGFGFFDVPEAAGIAFDVFPGAPAITGGDMVVFKGNYTDANQVARTGVYYRQLSDSPVELPDGSFLYPAAGDQPVVLIANSSTTLIPGSDRVFGSTAPPSAANHLAVFAGFDNEDDPTLGGIYLVPLAGSTPNLTTLVSIGGQVPGQNSKAVFNQLGEGVSFDGRFVGFWGAWGSETKTLVLQCPAEGNKDRVAFCNEHYPDGFGVQVPLHQGIFVHDIQTGQTRVVTRTPEDFDDFLYWNFSGHVPAMGEGDGEPARWRASAFLAVSSSGAGNSSANATFKVAYKARRGAVESGTYVDPVDGIYLQSGPGQSLKWTLVETGMPGTILDPEAVDAATGATLPVTEMGIERDGFRGTSIVVNASMGTEETGWAGIYLGEVR